MKKLIGKITCQDGQKANLYYNGPKQGLNAELEDGTDEDICYTADSLEDAYEAINIMYADSKWELEIISCE